MFKHLLWVGMFLAACGGGGGVGPDDLEDEFIDANCDFLVKCEGSPDKATCDASLFLDGNEFASILAAVDRGTITYDEDAAQACVDAIRGQGCEFDGFHSADPCEDVFQGTVQPGGACFVDLECAGTGVCNQTDPSCDPDVACCPGTCAMGPTESAAGGPCGDELHFCALGTYCKASATGGNGTCTAVVTMEGAACDEIDGCANPMYCNLDFMTGTGTCKAAPGSGETCSREDLLPCADNRDYCDPATMKCVRSAAVGAACGNGISCVDYASCINSVCVADLEAGAACTVDTGAECHGSLDCIGGVCTAPPPGMACQ